MNSPKFFKGATELRGNGGGRAPRKFLVIFDRSFGVSLSCVASASVLFQLRKKGEGGELLKKFLEKVPPRDASLKYIDLAIGMAQPTGQVQVQSWKPWPPRPMSPRYDWKIALIIPGGGFVEAHDKFAFEAPETVYELRFEINMPANLGSAWKVFGEKTLYFVYGNPKKYGRLNLRTDGDSLYVLINYVFNPSGLRNVEEKTSTVTTNTPQSLNLHVG